MNLEERRREILLALEQSGAVRVSELSRVLGCSEVTIRNDIRNLHNEGMLRKVHGGAVSIRPESQERAPSLSENQPLLLHEEEKRRIAAYAYEQILPLSTILIDDSTTCHYIATEILRHPDRPLSVVTNSLSTALLLHGAGHVELYMVGGSVGGRNPGTFGEFAVSFISGLRVDAAFIGVHSINFGVGFASVAAPQMAVKKAIFVAADRVYVLADSSKFERSYLFAIGPLADAYQIVTDSGVKPEYIERARGEHLPLVIV